MAPSVGPGQQQQRLQPAGWSEPPPPGAGRGIQQLTVVGPPRLQGPPAQAGRGSQLHSTRGGFDLRGQAARSMHYKARFYHIGHGGQITGPEATRMLLRDWTDRGAFRGGSGLQEAHTLRSTPSCLTRPTGGAPHLWERPVPGDCPHANSLRTRRGYPACPAVWHGAARWDLQARERLQLPLDLCRRSVPPAAAAVLPIRLPPRGPQEGVGGAATLRRHVQRPALCHPR